MEGLKDRSYKKWSSQLEKGGLLSTLVAWIEAYPLETENLSL